MLGYRALRTDRWLYVEYRNGAKELYDLRRDPYELHSLHAATRYRGLREFLRVQLQRLDDCRGAACWRPLRRAAAW